MKSYLKYRLVLLLVLSTTVAGMAQPTVWQKASNWSLYNVGGAKFYRVSLDSLERYRHRHLNDDSMRMYLTQSVDLASDKAPMWMGAYVASCTIEHKKRKIDISSYGGFFYDETDKKYYSVPQNLQKDWLNYLADCAGSLSTQ